MAAAFGLPVVVIFGASDPAIWGPWRTRVGNRHRAGGIAQRGIARCWSALARLRVHA